MVEHHFDVNANENENLPRPSRHLVRVAARNDPHFVKAGAIELFIRITLLVAFIITESWRPFIRQVHPEEMWLYRNPIPKKPYFVNVGGKLLGYLFDPVTPFESIIQMAMIAYPFIIVAVRLLYFKLASSEAREAIYAYTLSVPLTGVLINLIKTAVGRPRPDYIARCFGNDSYLSYTDFSRPCLRNDAYTYDGRKSFPSGHTGLAAACFGFMAVFLAGQLGTFQERPKNRKSPLLVFLPLMFAPVMVGISRTCDYKHHWQDVLVGGLVGYSVMYMCYRMYFPSITYDKSYMSHNALEAYYESVLSRGTSASSCHINHSVSRISDEERPLNRHNPRWSAADVGDIAERRNPMPPAWLRRVGGSCHIDVQMFHPVPSD